MSAYVVSITV